jgi:acetyl-CoA carboxylase biotin carboxyl carrier protein
VDLHWDDVRQVLAVIDAAPLGELELEIGDLLLVVRKRAPGPVGVPEPPSRAPVGGEFELKAPAVGVFRRGALRDAILFVEPGAVVQADEALALIEVVREAHPVRAPETVEVVAVLVADGDFVEYGQPLMILRPLGSSRP